MAVAYASHSTANNDSATASFTKPTGLAVGDLMVCVVMVADNLSNITESSGFSTLFEQAQDYGTCGAYYKVATSGDVAASTFDFTSSSGRILGILYRFTGADSTHITAGLTATLPHNPYSNPCAVIVIGATSDNDGTTGNFSTYSVTGGHSPTFTERFDGSNATTLDISLGVADASYESLSNITNFSVTVPGSVDDSDSFLITVPGVTNASGTHALHSADADFFAPTASSGTLGSNALLQADADFLAPTAKGTSPSQWTPESKPSTTWTPETK